MSATAKLQNSSEAGAGAGIALAKIAEACGARLEGDGDALALRILHPADASQPSDLAVAMDPDILPLLHESAADMAVLAEGAVAPKPLRAALYIARPRVALSVLTNLFSPPLPAHSGIHPTACVGAGSAIHPECTLGPYVVVGENCRIGRGTRLAPHVTLGDGVQLGEDCRLHAGVRIAHGVQIGNRVQIHPNSVIGGDGFSFVTPEPGSIESARSTGLVHATNQHWLRIASLGPVIVGDDVEIGAGTMIDRGTLRPTRIGRGSKIDNLVQIGHNVQVGEDALLCGQVGIAGSVRVGNRVVIGGAVGVADHRKIGDDAVILARSGIATNVPPKAVFGGFLAFEHKEYTRSLFAFRRLPRTLARLEKLLADSALEPLPEKE